MLAVLPLAVALTNCDQADKPKLAKAGTYAFDISVKFSPKAEAVLKQSQAGLVVDAWYYGDAAPAAHDKADSLGRIFLGDENWNFSGNARKMHLKGEPIDTAKLPQIRGPVLVFLTVETVAGDEDNPVKCHAFIGPIQQAQQTSPVITCEMDTEQYWEDVEESSSPAP
ncbi:MAG: hypothetical protein JF571_10385 [Asticcacaulis sp.]|nr:hypothetical protein [Asticcacaulis sp.]